MTIAKSVLHCSISPDLMNLQVFEPWAIASLGIKVAGALGSKHDT